MMYIYIYIHSMYAYMLYIYIYVYARICIYIYVYVYIYIYTYEQFEQLRGIKISDSAIASKMSRIASVNRSPKIQTHDFSTDTVNHV